MCNKSTWHRPMGGERPSESVEIESVPTNVAKTVWEGVGTTCTTAWREEDSTVVVRGIFHNSVLVKIPFAFISIPVAQSVYNFAHVMTAELSCHVQSCVLIE